MGSARADTLRRHVRRAAYEEQALQEMCEWLAVLGADILGSVTFSDEYAEAHRIFAVRAALRDVLFGLRRVPMMGGRKVGFGAGS